jgi:hypothetical protein
LYTSLACEKTSNAQRFSTTVITTATTAGITTQNRLRHTIALSFTGVHFHLRFETPENILSEQGILKRSVRKDKTNLNRMRSHECLHAHLKAFSKFVEHEN